MDVYVWGEYPIAGMKFLKEKGWAPTILEGDTELLKEGKPDFMGVNYYRTGTFEKILLTAWELVDLILREKKELHRRKEFPEHIKQREMNI